MTFINLPSVGSLNLDANNILLRSITRGSASRYAVSHLLYGKIVRSARRAGFSRRAARKIANRRRRNFVDNIIMHHKRIHDQNRHIVITNARERALLKKKKQDSLKNHTIEKIKKEKEVRMNYSRFLDGSDLKTRASETRSRINTRRIRAQSRWASIIKAKA